MKKLFLIVSLVVTSITLSLGQNYRTGLGLRAAFEERESGAGFTFKTFNSSSAAFEGIIRTDFENWVAFTGLFELHKPVPDVDRLNWYYGFGGGLSVNTWNNEPVDQNNDGKINNLDLVDTNGDRITDSYEYKRGTGLGIGLDGIIGLEYTVTEIPFAFSFDWKPYFSIINNTGLHVGIFGLSVRYTLK